MTSHRNRKKQAQSRGMTVTELELVELLEEILDNMRWTQILAYSNQYLMNQKLEVTQAERDKVLEAATRAVDKDAKLHDWRQRLAGLKGDTRALGKAVQQEVSRQELHQPEADQPRTSEAAGPEPGPQLGPEMGAEQEHADGA